jgi:5-methylcytosine-specific restriction protein B
MNTADKSIALLDIALRRRFVFEAMYPRTEIPGQVIHDAHILRSINEQIVKKKNHDFQIGHAYFMGSDYKRADRMNNKVIPLLLEYFMNDGDTVKDILKVAGLSVKADMWPLQVEE